MSSKNINSNRKDRRKRRVSANMFGVSEKPRIVINRSCKETYAQVIDDQKRVTMVSFSTLQLRKQETYKKVTKSQQAFLVGEKLGGLMSKKKIKQAIFDRGVCAYLGRVKELAEGLRKSGLKV